MRLFFLKIQVIFLIGFAFTASAEETILFYPLDNNQIQPQLLTDNQQRTHLLYFDIENPSRRSGNLYYKQFQADDKSWTKPIKVSSKALGTPGVIAGAKIAVDAQGRVHVAWLQTDPLAYLYTRSNNKVSKFEKQREVTNTNLDGVDAGASIAAFGSNVLVSWGAGPLDNEAGRTIFSALSTDYGETFNPSSPIGDRGLGACACCGMASQYLSDGTFLAAYRSAVNGSGRHMQLLSVKPDGVRKTTMAHEWNLNACPVTTNNFSRRPGADTWLAFETKGEIFQFNTNTPNVSPTIVRSNNRSVRQKHPVIAINSKGERIIVWNEGRGFQSGGQLKYQRFNSMGEANPSKDPEPMPIANNSFSAVTALADNSFLIVH